MDAASTMAPSGSTAAARGTMLNATSVASVPRLHALLGEVARFTAHHRLLETDRGVDAMDTMRKIRVVDAASVENGLGIAAYGSDLGSVAPRPKRQQSSEISERDC